LDIKVLLCAFVLVLY